MSSVRRLIPATVRILGKLSPSLAAAFAVELFFRPSRGKRTGTELEFWNRGEKIEFASGCRGRIFDGSGPTIWFVHGWESRGSHFQTLIEACLRDGYRVIAWEGPAHGESPGRKTNLAEFARALKTDVEKTSGRILALVGHSFGGGAAAYACRLGLRSDLLILLATPSNVEGVFGRFWQLIQLAPIACDRFVEKIESSAHVRLAEVSLRGFIADLPQRLLIVHDEEDREIPFEDAKELQALRPDAAFLPTTGLGHRRLLKSPFVAEKLVDFLNSSLGRNHERG